MKNILASLVIAGALMVGVATGRSAAARVADDEMYREPLQTGAVMAQMDEQNDQYLQVEARLA